MRTNVFKEARISLYILASLMALSILFYVFASMFTSVGYKGFRKAKQTVAEPSYVPITVIMDPGHGGEDPGAVDNGLTEKDLNLDVALSLNDILTACGYNTALTRTEDMLLYKQGEENRKKYYDLRNREVFAEEFENSVFVSLHMNKFPAEYCKGAQTFYSEHDIESKNLATSVQENVRLLQKNNKRVIKSGNNTIYLLDNLDMPSILIECGFLSNREEALSLSDKNYRAALAFTIYCGIAEYLEKI